MVGGGSVQIQNMLKTEFCKASSSVCCRYGNPVIKIHQSTSTETRINAGRMMSRTFCLKRGGGKTYTHPSIHPSITSSCVCELGHAKGMYRHILYANQIFAVPWIFYENRFLHLRRQRPKLCLGILFVVVVVLQLRRFSNMLLHYFKVGRPGSLNGSFLF